MFTKKILMFAKMSLVTVLQLSLALHCCTYKYFKFKQDYLNFSIYDFPYTSNLEFQYKQGKHRKGTSFCCNINIIIFPLCYDIV